MRLNKIFLDILSLLNFIDECKSWSSERKQVTFKDLMSGNLPRYKQDDIPNKKCEASTVEPCQETVTSSRLKEQKEKIRVMKKKKWKRCHLRCSTLEHSHCQTHSKAGKADSGSSSWQYQYPKFSLALHCQIVPVSSTGQPKGIDAVSGDVSPGLWSEIKKVLKNYGVRWHKIRLSNQSHPNQILSSVRFPDDFKNENNQKT